MIQLRVNRRRKHTHTPLTANHKARPTLEGLEDRLLLYATSGGRWEFGSRITYSFAPDGTNVGGVPSALFQTMQNAGWTTANWELQFQKAASVWEAVANINLTEVSDNGEDIGAAGDQQDDPNVGDIRIGATPQVSGQLAFAFLPPPFNGGTDAGDIFFNTTQNWNATTGFDVETVAIHEFGHALGMSHSAITSAVMYATYNATKQSLTTDDISGIQSIYGAVPADGVSNATYLTATDLTPQLSGGQAAVGGLALVSASDVDWYKITVPSTTNGTMTVTMQAAGLSSLSPRMTVYESVLGLPVGLVTASNPNSYGGNATATITGVLPGEVFFFKDSAANGGSSAIGAYGMLINFTGGSQAPVAPPNTVVASQPDQGGGTASELTGGATVPTTSDGDPPSVVQSGTLTGFGDALTIESGPRGRLRLRPRSHANEAGSVSKVAPKHDHVVVTLSQHVRGPLGRG